MRVGGSTRTSGWARRTAAAIALAVALPLGVTMVGGGATASAAFDPAAQDFWVDSAMGPIKSRIWRAADGNTNRVVYLLDGLRAQDDLKRLGGQHRRGPVPRVAEHQRRPAGRRTVQLLLRLDFELEPQRPEDPVQVGDVPHQELRDALANRLGFQSTRNGVIGLSMGGSAALTLAAYHPEQFNYAGSLSGYLNISAPGMREAIRIAMLDAGRYNVDSMWGPPWNPAWLRNDPFVFANKLRDNNTRLWVSAANGIPAPGGAAPTGFMDVFNASTGASLEALSLANTRAFQVKMATLGAKNVTYSFPPRGIHTWRYWQQQIHDLAGDLGNTIG